MLKRCANTLAPAVTKLVRLLLAQGRWPQAWRLHWIAPLYKKGSYANPENYRGVHLTPVLSKVVERVVNRLLGPFFESTNSFGVSQWAFRQKSSCNDLVTLLTCYWVLAFQNREKVEVFLSDIAAAFDRVDRELLLRKLASITKHHALGLPG